MKKLRIISLILSFIFVFACAISAANAVAKIKGETSHTEKTLYNGVTHAEINTDANTATYGQQHFNVVTFDLSQRDLYLETAYYNNVALVNGSSTLTNYVKQYNGAHSDKTVIAAINGDMWFVSSQYSGVVKSSSSFTSSRSFNIVNGEIYTSGIMPAEPSYAGISWSFCITEDYVPNLGQPVAHIVMTNTTRGKSVEVNGINRLPANNSIVMYTDRVMGTYNDFAPDDAYELLIEFEEDYTMRHGANVTGTLKAIYTSADEANPPKINEKQMVITARGTKTSFIKKFNVGDKINFTVEISDACGRDDLWQKAYQAIGGNMAFIKDGVKTGADLGLSNYPTTLLGYDKNGKIIMLTMDGRNKGGTGASSKRLYQIVDDLDLYDALLLDGGGSMTMRVANNDTYTSYTTVSTSSDGSERKINNAFILAFGPERGEQGKIEIFKEFEKITDPTNVTFPTKNHVRSFVTNPNETTFTREDECLKLTVSNKQNDDPYAGFSYSSADKFASADTYKYLVLVYKIPLTNSASSYVSELFCMCNNTGAAGGKNIQAHTYRTGNYEYAVFNPGSLSTSWTGNITSLRIDYFAGILSTMKNGDSIFIHNILLAKTEEEAKELGSSIAFDLNNRPETETETETESEAESEEITEDTEIISEVSETGSETETETETGSYTETEEPETEGPETEPEESETEPVEDAVKGDCNGDGEADNKDVVALFRYVSTGTSEYDPKYDFNGDKEVNNKDVVALFRYLSSAA